MKYFKSLIIVIGLLILPLLSSAQQCRGDFKFKVTASERGTSTGKIEILIKNPTQDNYVFKVFKVSGEIKLVKTKMAASPQSIIIEGLEPADYYVKIEWGSCQKTIGGIEGVTVSMKAEEK